MFSGVIFNIHPSGWDQIQAVRAAPASGWPRREPPRGWQASWAK